MFYDRKPTTVAGAEPASPKEEAIGKLLTLGVVALGVWAVFFRERKPERRAVEFAGPMDDDL